MANREELTTAHRAWDERWSSDEGRAPWLEPEQAVRRVVRLLRERGVRRVLDLGCGIGRHALFLAGEGFEVVAIDASETGVQFARDRAAEAGLEIDFRPGSFLDLPFRDGGFGYVLAWNVIYHGEVVGRALSEAWRVLAPGGLFQATMLSKRHREYGRGREIRPNTFINDAPDDSDKDHPHFFCNARELLALLDGFDLWELRDHAQDDRDAYHWEFLVERQRHSER